MNILASALLFAALAQLPPNHPPVPSQVPPNHPPMGGNEQAPAAMPGHPPMRGGTAPSVEELLQRLEATPGLKERTKTFEIAMSVGNLYFSNARFGSAAEFFGQAWELAKPIRDAYAKVKNQQPKREACPEPTAQLAKLVEALPSYTQEQRTACAHVAMETVAEAGEGQGAALFLAGRADAALKAYEAVLAELPTHPESLFGRASVLLETRGDDVASLQRARQDLQTLQKTQSGSPRAFRARTLLARIDEAIAAGGVQKLAAKKAEERRKNPPQVAAAAPPPPPAAGPMPQLSQETMQAFQNVERTPELEQKLTALVEEGEAQLAKNDFQQAMDRYRQVMPLDPENGRVRAGLAWAMIGLQRPAADRIWSVAVESDPAAVEMLGVTLEASGNKESARAIWKKLAESAPDYAQQTGLAERLR